MSEITLVVFKVIFVLSLFATWRWYLKQLFASRSYYVKN